jgi:hypothetical protein
MLKGKRKPSLFTAEAGVSRQAYAHQFLIDGTGNSYSLQHRGLFVNYVVLGLDFA